MSMSPRDRGNAHTARGELTEAAQCYREAVRDLASDASGWIGLGFVLGELGQHEESLEALGRARTLAPETPDVHYLLGRSTLAVGNKLRAIEHYEDAIRLQDAMQEAHRDLLKLLIELDASRAVSAARRATALFPGSPEFWFYRGMAEERAGHSDSALASYRNACSLQKDAHAAHYNAARILWSQEKYREALPHYEIAAAIAHDNPDILVGLGNTRMKLGDNNGAVESYRRALALRHDDIVAHTLASLVGEAPERAPDKYVTTLFDAYAERFDSHLVDVLKYDSPKDLANMIRSAWTASGDRRVLDLGCGTGLMGVALGMPGARLTGVDLSSGMLAKARARGIYDRLVQSDLETMMAREHDCAYEAIVAADVFVYVGKLDTLFVQVQRLLVPEGLFAFSVEAAGPATPRPDRGVGYALHALGRYVHEREYLKSLGASNAFTLLEMKDTVCRESGGVPVRAYHALFRRK